MHPLKPIKNDPSRRLVQCGFKLLNIVNRTYSLPRRSQVYKWLQLKQFSIFFCFHLCGTTVTPLLCSKSPYVHNNRLTYYSCSSAPLMSSVHSTYFTSDWMKPLQPFLSQSNTEENSKLRKVLHASTLSKNENKVVFECPSDSRLCRLEELATRSLWVPVPWELVLRDYLCPRLVV